MSSIRHKYVQEDSDLVRLFPGAGPGDRCLLKKTPQGVWAPLLYAEKGVSLDASKDQDNYMLLVVLPRLTPSISQAIIGE